MPGTGLNHVHTPLLALPPARLPALAPLHVLIQRNPTEGEEEKRMGVGRERKDRSLSSRRNNVCYGSLEQEELWKEGRMGFGMGGVFLA